MEGVVLGFATIVAVIGVGALIAHLGVVDLSAQKVLSHIAFFVASPALLLTTVSQADTHDVLSRSLVATVVGVAVPAAIYVVVAWWRWRRSVGRAGHRCAGELLRQRGQPRPAGRGLRARRRRPRGTDAAAAAARAAAAGPGRARRRRARAPADAAPHDDAAVHQPADDRHAHRAAAVGHRLAAATDRARPDRADRRDGGARDAARLRHRAAPRPGLRRRRADRRAGADEHAQARRAAAGRVCRGAPRARPDRSRPAGRRRVLEPADRAEHLHPRDPLRPVTHAGPRHHPGDHGGAVPLITLVVWLLG